MTSVQGRNTKITVVLDEESEAYHVTAGRDHSSAMLGDLLRRLAQEGFTPLEPDEHPEEVLEDDSVRIWLCRDESAKRLGLVAHIDVAGMAGVNLSSVA